MMNEDYYDDYDNYDDDYPCDDCCWSDECARWCMEKG